MTDPAATGEIHPLEQQRRDKRERARSLGFDPYGTRRDDLIPLDAAHRRHDQAAEEAFKAAGKEPPPGFVDPRPVVSVAGRVVLHRDNGKLVWMNLRDDTGDLQVAASQRDCDPAGFELAKTTDLGDLLVATGPLMKTRTGEVTVWASRIEPAAKCLTPPPEKHAGLQDVELRYRRRYVDLWATPETMRIFKLRSRIISRLRRYLDQRGFLEVETPILQQQAGGAAARPFITHMNALDADLYLRIAPELYLKRLLVGGMPRVYEISRNFRNEGLDKRHNPEFTMLEAYWAHADVVAMMDLLEGAIRDAAQMVAVERQDARGLPADEDQLPTAAELTLPFDGYTIDYGSPFTRLRYDDLFARVLGFEPSDAERVRAEVVARGLSRRIKGAALPPGGGGGDDRDLVRAIAPVLLVNTLFEEVAEPALDPARPTYITHYPSAISPLTRPNPDDPAVADRADLFIGHMEIGPLYTELNDPDVQEAKFREQLAGIDEEESTFRTFDRDFIDALKVGMPPAGGLGCGIDRLAMLLTGERSIRDVLLFPMMRTEE